jgi:hypothetical protein
MTTFKPLAFVSAVAALTVALPTSAHHAVNAQFDVEHLVPKTGVLTGLDNLNPHAYWHFDIKGPDGKPQKWNIESVAPNALRRAGISIKEDIVVGKTYSFQIAPSRNNTNTGLLIVLDVAGKSVRLAPQ